MRARVMRVGAAMLSVAWLSGVGQPSRPRAQAGRSADWPVVRGEAGGTQYSPLAQIHAANVDTLQPVWTYHTGDATPRSTMYTNPVVVDGVMYLTTPSLKAVALDAATGRERWVFDPARYNGGQVIRLRNRGLTYWRGEEGARIFHFVRDRVYAIDARTGQLIPSFGTRGVIDLRQDLGVDPASVAIEMTSPGVIYRNLLIVGSRVNESYDASPGHIRAFDVLTGTLKWIFHTIPQDGEFGADTWRRQPGERYGGANAWGGLTVDERRGWVFAATGSATEDFYGGFRKGSNLFANSVIALDAATGVRKWHYQTVHHDIWDYDNPTAPILATITTGSSTRDVVVQLTKMGYTFVLDRDTGTPVFPVVEGPVPASTVPGEEAWPTQPMPVKPRPLVRQALTEADLTTVSPAAHEYARREFRRYDAGAMYTPPTLRGTITQPGHMGGSEWNGGAFDPALNVLYVNVNDAPTINRLRPVYANPVEAPRSPMDLGRDIYERACASCHGIERRGTPPVVPPLIDLTIGREAVLNVVRQGRNVMPGFPQLSSAELNALATFVLSPAGGGDGRTPDAVPERYTIQEYVLFTDPDGLPAIAPPWGTLNAIDLASGDLLWKVPLGEYPQLVAKGIRHTGSMNFGGAVATAGGVVFVAATADEKLRAFESHSGRVLWEFSLPAAGYATPSVYMVDGRQFVAIAAGGGGKNATPSGDAVVAFALPTGPVARDTRVPARQPGEGGWITLFDGTTLDGWVHLNGAHEYSVEDGAIVGRTVERSAAQNSFLCSTAQFGNFELELQTMVDRVTNQGIQIRTRVREVAGGGRGGEFAAGRVYGPQVEVRRYYPGLSTTGLLYGEALGTGWLSSPEKIANGHHAFVDDGWNTVSIIADGPRIQTWVNGQPVEDLTLEAVYRTHPSGHVCLQLHGMSARELSSPPWAGSGVGPSEPLISRWRQIRIRPR